MKKSSNAEGIAQDLHSAAIRVLRSVRRADRSSSLNAARLSALSVVVYGRPMTLGQIAEAEQVRPPTMTRIIDALEEHGLVEKRRDERDRRNVYLSATRKGKRILIEARNRRIQMLAKAIDGLEPAEKETLLAAINVLAKMMRP